MGIPCGEVMFSSSAAMAASGGAQLTPRGNQWWAADPQQQRCCRPRALHLDVVGKIVSKRHVGMGRDRVSVSGYSKEAPAMAAFEGLRKIDANAMRLTSRRSRKNATWHSDKPSNGHRYTNSLGPFPAAAESQEKGSAAPEARPLVVVGSVNADIYVEIERLPLIGETISARTGNVLPGGKGANQAACAAKLGYPAYLVAQVGRDTNAILVRDTLAEFGVHLDLVSTVPGPTGHALVMLQPKGKNSIIIVGGANVTWPRLGGGSSRLKPSTQALIKRAGALVLQREVPDSVNLEAARIARNAGIPVVLDCGGSDTPLADELIQCITILSPNETELARLTNRPTESLDEVLTAGQALLGEMGKAGQVLVKRGEHGAVLIKPDGQHLNQPAIVAPTVVDTTGAGDTFTAAYTVALLQRTDAADALQFAAAAACICVQRKGAMISMPGKKEVEDLLEDQKRKGLIPSNEDQKKKGLFGKKPIPSVKPPK